MKGWVSKMERAKRSAVILFACTVALLVALPAQADVSFLPDFTIAFPPGSKSVARLVVPPVSDAVLDQLGPSSASFGVGPGDAVWFGQEPDLLIQASNGYRFRVGVPVSDIAILDDGTLLVVSAGVLGFIAADNASAAFGAGNVTVAFQPIVTLPFAEARLASGGKGALYIFGTDGKSGRNEVFLLRPEASAGSGTARALRTIRKIFSTTERISSVAGDGNETFVATGRFVLKVSDGAVRIAPAFLHPKEEITGIVWSRKSGLFYATRSGVGSVSSDGSFEFVRVPNPAIRLVNDTLYILLRNSFAVVKVEGINAYRPKKGKS